MRVLSSLPVFSVAIALLASLTGAVGLWLNVAVLESPLPWLPPIEPGGAALLILLAVALLLTSPAHPPLSKGLANIVTGAAFMYAVVILLEIPGVERLGPMLYLPPAATSLSGALLGLAFILLQARTPRAMTIDVEFGPDGEALDRPVEVGAPRAHAKGLSFDFDEADDLPAKVLGDPTRVVQVLLNLLGNAVKFTSRGRVLLSVRRGERDIIVFRVEDTGIGISETEMARLFHPFEQADNSTRRHDGGTGLGLAISWWT